MTVKDFIKKLLCRACIYFSCIMLCYIIVAAIVNVGDGDLLLEAGRTVLFFVFSLLFALANALFAFDKMSGGTRVLLHYLITAFAFYACFMLPLSMRASSIIVGLVVFSLVYFAVLGLSSLFRSRYRANIERAQKYQKQYDKAKR